MNKFMKSFAVVALLSCPAALAAEKQEPKKCKMSAKDGTTYVDLVRQSRELEPVLREAKARVQALEQAQAQIQKHADEVTKPYVDGMHLDAKAPWGFMVEDGEVVLVELPTPPAPAPSPEPAPKK